MSMAWFVTSRPKPLGITSTPSRSFQSRYIFVAMRLTTSFAALYSVVVIALCLGQAHADSVTTPLALTHVDDKGKPVTPLTYLNLEPSAKELADAAKKITTPPPLPAEHKRLLPSDQLQPFVGQISSQGLAIKRELGHSLVPSLPILGALDNEGDHTNQAPPAKAAGEKRLLDALKALQPGEGTEYLPENHQTLGQRTVHPLNRRAEEDPLDVNIFGQNLHNLALPKLSPSKRSKSIGLNVLGEDVPLDRLSLPGLGSRDVQPLDLGLKTGNQQDLDSAEGLFKGVLPFKRHDASAQPLDLGLKTGNKEDLQRADSFLTGLLGGSAAKRDSISPDGIDLGSFKSLGDKFAKQAQKDALPLLFAPVKQAASPAVQGISTVNQVCTAFDCAGLVKGTLESTTKELGLPAFKPIQLPSRRRALGDKDLFANGLLNNGGEVEGIPIKRAIPGEDVATKKVLGLSDEAQDAVLGVKDAVNDVALGEKDKVNNVAGEFVKHLYSKQAKVETKRDLTLPPFSLLPGTGPQAKEAVKETIDFLGLPIPGVKRMHRVRRKQQ
ncbi:serine/threonine-protein kinase Sgk2 [Pseudozyma hubeiensis SY62]|uniref:Serine/threonine-protein kinase Sgk2 n=1 Tax=Pseudozyma hubeiensis (strain SY62) TaxID=1305764 RepID=R9PC80_PSEHS|nr:serine/threonine-protein kinase Sgk2 [Pseudozyma hubeiensis SY62]GAC98981.1 serine/threonine-protein kinase Sgk2 [Pseudozyma hubeiensis SY62]